MTLTPSSKLWTGTLWSYDKIGHAGLFFGWTWNYLSLRKFHFNAEPSYFDGLLSCGLFGGIIEILQFILPIRRSAEIVDLAADLLGGFIAVVLFLHVVRFANKE